MNNTIIKTFSVPVLRPYFSYLKLTTGKLCSEKFCIAQIYERMSAKFYQLNCTTASSFAVSESKRKHRRIAEKRRAHTHTIHVLPLYGYQYLPKECAISANIPFIKCHNK